jgi:hypothetical protein
MATPTRTATSTTVYPRSGFFSSQFWVGLLAVLATFVLGEYGKQLGQALPTDQITKILEGQTNLVVGVLIVGVIAAFISISSWIETRTVVKSGPGKNSHPRPARKPFYETSEFYLGLVTIVLNYLHDTGVFAPDVSASTSTTTLVVAFLYTFARAQLKQAYANAQAEEAKAEQQS